MSHQQTGMSWFILLALLSVLALIGNTFSLALLFGVDVLFGSIATLLALFWLAPLAGLIAFRALKLRRRHQVLIEALSQAQTGVIITERRHGDDLITYVNSGFETMTGYSAAEVSGRNCRFMQGEDRAQAARGQMRTALHDGDTCNVIMRNYRKDGTRFWNSLHLSPMRDRAGQVTHYIGVQQDVTEAIETLERLRLSEARLQEAQAIAHVGSWELDLHSGQAQWSDETFRLFGFAPGATQASLDSFLKVVDPAHSKRLARAFTTAKKHPAGVYQAEFSVLGPDGIARTLLQQGRLHRDTEGAPERLVGTCLDVTEQKEAEVELAKRETMVSELLALATGFVGVSDHSNDESTEQALARIGDFIDADRSYLVYLSANGSKVDKIFEWSDENVAPIGAHYIDLPTTKLPMMMAQLAVGEPVIITNVAEFDASGWVRERNLIETQRVQSLLLAPLQLDEHLFGFVGVEMVRSPRQWSAIEAQFLQLFANILVASEQRTRSLLALKQSNARYDALARQSRTITWELDPEGRFTYISDVCEAVLGYAPAEMLGRHYTDYIAEPEAREQAAIAADLMARRQPFEELIIPFRSRAGDPLWLSSDGRPILTEDGPFLGYRGTTKDVTERQRTLQRLAHSESRLSAIFENTPIGIALIGQNRRPLMVNQALTRFLGREAEILTYMRLDDITHPNDLHGALGELNEVLKGQRDAYRTTSRYLHADGQVLWGDLRVSLLPSSTEEEPIALAMIENITDLHEARERQRAAEQELTDYAEQLESLLDLVNLSVPYMEQIQALLRLARRSLRLDSAAAWRLEADARCRLLRAVPDGPTPPQAPPPALVAEASAEIGNPVIIASAEATEAPSSGAHWDTHPAMIGVVIDCTTPDGDQEQLLLTLAHATAIPPLELGQRQLLRLIAQRIAAVRHRDQLQENLVQSRERETIGHLASGVSHDFNNLLGVIDANLFFIADGLGEQAAADPEIGQVIDETRSALGQAKIITSGMLTISGSGKIPLESIDLASTIGEFQPILGQVLPPRIQLQIDVETGLQAYSNRAFLQSALLNLALNARDAMSEQGTLTIAARPVHADTARQPRIGSIPASECIEVRVADTGNGIAPELLERIFEPLFSTKAKRRGHGLGLFMVREFVVRTQAGLWVDSDAGQGTCFRLLLPAQATPQAPPDTHRAQTPAALDAPPALSAPESRRVLLVEDDRRVRDALSRLLKIEGFSVATASHGQDALRQLATMEGTIDLVLSDIAMPVMDGLDLFARLSEQFPSLPVILMTGQQAHWEPPLNSRGEPVPILRKPIDLGTLKESMHQMLPPNPNARA
ncbi:PAS domain S-box protein [Halochromatium salexigens]|nr:PAS domain S-box protein [Halochromatium salexigens]